MLPLSAVDAIKPAFRHTSQFLLAPRSWRLLLKLCTVAFFAQMGGCNLNLSAPGSPPHGGSATPSGAWITLLILLGILALTLGLGLFYVGSRLQLVLFQAVVTRQSRIGPMWAGSRQVVWRWIGLKLAFFLTALLCSLPLLIPLIIHFIRAMPLDQSASAASAAFIAEILSFIAAVFILILLVSIAYILIADFCLPALALEHVPIAESVRWVLRFVRQEPGEVALYVLLRVLLGLAGGIVSYIAILLIAVVLAIPLAGIAYGFYALLHHGGPAAHVLMIASWITLGIALATVILLSAITFFGACFTFLQAYAVYFLAGRYPLLASLLEPGPGNPFTPPPPFPSPEEDGGTDPPFPMDPALA